jgi:CxxC motif-containing protein (DUF1111 family)
VAPLFAGAPAGAPIVSVDGAGVITTRGAGRVRGRHELEAEFSIYLPLYFENRTYAFTIEDTVAAGGSTVSFTYGSLGAPANTPLTNLRVWKVYGGGNVFHENLDMQRLDGRRSVSVIRSNGRERRPLRKGDLLEFEFGVFLDSAQVPGRTNYYTDTFRYRVGEGGLTAANADPAVGELGPSAEGLLGGAATVPYLVVEPQMAYSQMALDIQPETAEAFLAGRRLFHTSFLAGAHSEPNNPAFLEHGGKLGPLFNEESCTGCHLRNGRGSPPEAGSPLRSLVIKAFGPTGPGGEPSAHPTFGRQVQNRALAGAGEADPSIVYQVSERRLPDGTVVQLRKPTVDWRGLEAPARTSLRLARPLVGLGLLEAVPEAAILARADPGDCNGDVISGRPNLARDPQTGAAHLGRFGWKASKVSLRHQVADALLVDMGITTSLFPLAECRGGVCPPEPPELSDTDLDRLATYMRALGVPPRRRLSDPKVQRGATVFAAVGCISCHIPSIQTGGDHPLVELRNQTIYPYSDLLLHDMGADLADDSEREYAALPSEWRTPPLWSVGLTETVSGQTRLLHDGRARSFLEAILWHGGEAVLVRERAAALPTEDREALLAFLGSL